MNISQVSRKKNIENLLADAQKSEGEKGSLNRNLTLRDLTSLSIAAIIGAGIFGTIGNASASGGPAVSLLFIFTAVACGFSAMCYAEFASRVPISGSAYTYAYVSLGELIAWIVGWTLLMEYSVGNIAVAISWSDYFTSFLSGFNIHIPKYLTIDYLSAFRGYEKAAELIKHGNAVPEYLKYSCQAWTNAPVIGTLRIVANIPAFLITCIITWLVFIGIKETKKAANLMVIIKIIVIIIVISIGAFYVNPANWVPFAPNGLSGVLKGISAVFFAYIGFDAISTTSEECNSPQRDLPKAMILSLLICTILYICVTLVLTGMVKYNELAVGDPLSFVFSKHHLNWISGIISFSAIIAMASVLLVFQVGQPRIWMSMSRDGLLPAKFSSIHHRYKTPGFSTIITGIVVGIPSLFMNMTEVTDLTSIGTLFAFVIVCAGVLSLKPDTNQKDRYFHLPYINGKYILLFIFILIILCILIFYPQNFKSFIDFSGGWNTIKHKMPAILFLIICIYVTYLTFIKNYSLIPVLGLIINLYLMTELGVTNWARFLIWLVIGLIIYFSYSIKNSRMEEGRKEKEYKGR